MTRNGHASLPVEVVEPDDDGAFGDEPTQPGADVVVSNRVLYRLLQRLSKRISLLAVAVFFMAASMVVFGLLIWWSR